MPRDLLHRLPVPAKIRDYLDTPFYYSEAITTDASNCQRRHLNDADDADEQHQT